MFALVHCYTRDFKGHYSLCIQHHTHISRGANVNDGGGIFSVHKTAFMQMR